MAMPSSTQHRVAVALEGGAARGLATIGVLHLFEREGIRPRFIAGPAWAA